MFWKERRFAVLNVFYVHRKQILKKIMLLIIFMPRAENLIYLKPFNNVSNYLWPG